MVLGVDLDNVYSIDPSYMQESYSYYSSNLVWYEMIDQLGSLGMERQNLGLSAKSGGANLSDIWVADSR